MSKHYETKPMHSSSWRTLQQYQECDRKAHSRGDPTISNKQTNNQTILMDGLVCTLNGFVCLLQRILRNFASPSCVCGIIGKLSTKRGAQALFRGIWIYGVKSC